MFVKGGAKMKGVMVFCKSWWIDYMMASKKLKKLKWNILTNTETPQKLYTNKKN